MFTARTYVLILMVTILFSGCSLSQSEQKNNAKSSEKSAVQIQVMENQAEIKEIKIFLAKEIRTMEPDAPEATAVAVASGIIVAVGNMETMKPWMDSYPTTIDSSFIDKVLTPGLIDPHVHPSLPAVLTQFPFVAPDDWHLPTGDFPGATTPEEYVELLTKQVDIYFEQEGDAVEVPFIAWGYHSLWHGDMSKEKLDELYGDKPVMLWHRSFHEIIASTAALELLKIDDEYINALDSHARKEMDWEHGHFWENGFMSIIPQMSFLFEPARYGKGMHNFFDMMRESGVTSVMDMGIGVFGDPVGETALIRKTADEYQVPGRIVLTPIITDFLFRGKSPEEALAEINEWKKGNTDRVRIENHFKIMMDGAIYSGLSQYNSPGYIDKHEGIWMAPLETTYEYAEYFWNEGYQIHAHTNGDKSADALIDILRKLQAQKPRIDHRMSLEHFAYVTESQAEQMSALGMIVSANPYYQYILSDIYAENWLGPDRAKNMVPLGALVRNNIKFSLHSDCPMAPLSPLTLVWAAVNRTTINGNDNNEFHKVSVEEAMRAVTIDAAWGMGWENRVGSIKAGKVADFAVLEEDPFTVDPMHIKDIEVWGVIYEGEPFPVE